MERAALVTGGGIRLGKHIALHLARSGWDIALHYHSSQEEARKTQNEILALNQNCELIKYDLSIQDNFRTLLELAYSRFPNLLLLINNASLYEASLLQDTSLKVWDRLFAVNLRAPFFLSQAFIRVLKTSQIELSHANIINILDNKISFVQYHYTAYVLSKKALTELSLLSAAEFAPLRVNAIAPGVILPMPSRKKNYLDWRLEAIPLKKQGGVKNILQAMDYILSNDFMTGQILTVDGGEGLGAAGHNFASFKE